MDIGSGRGRRSGPSRRVSSGGEAEGGSDGGDGGGDGGDGSALPVPTSTWGQAPDRLSSVGLDEDAATFFSRLRCVRLWLSSLSSQLGFGAEGPTISRLASCHLALLSRPCCTERRH